MRYDKVQLTTTVTQIELTYPVARRVKGHFHFVGLSLFMDVDMHSRLPC
jgi:hypothetical protein